MSQLSPDTRLPREHELRALSEAQLRRLYDEEEVERFLSFFSTYVTEVRLTTDVVIVDNPEATTEATLIPRSIDRSFSEHVAYDYILPRLPPAAGVTPTFTLERLNLTVQRLCLALFPPYRAFLLNLARLALWNDYRRSLRYCTMFWFLWLHDLLLPAFMFRIVYGLLRRRLSNYPTLRELQERRQDTAQALGFWELVRQRLSITTLGPVDLWRLFKLYRSEGESKTTPMQKDAIETSEEENFKCDMLRMMHELADLHERIKNISVWQRPDVTRRYLLFLVVVGFGVLLLPAHCTTKLVYWFWGTIFWHVTPVVAALPRGDRIRQVLLSLLFGDAPTDADYAIELIAKRLATGQEVSLGSQSRRTLDASSSKDNLKPASCGNSEEIQLSEYETRHWKKWGERVARGKAFLEEGMQFLSSHTSRILVSGEAVVGSRSGTSDNKHMFFAQYGSSLGLITLTPSTLFFMHMTGPPRLVIPRDRLRGVRRSGLTKGISIIWISEGTIDGEEREERFHCVGNRDELFARLVGADGGRWIPV